MIITALTAVLVFVSLEDLRNMKIPNSLHFVGIFLSLISHFYDTDTLALWYSLGMSALTLLVLLGLDTVVSSFLPNVPTLGGGDLKLLTWLACFPNISIFFLLLSACFAALFDQLLVKKNLKMAHQSFAFAPYIAIMALLQVMIL